MSMLSTQEKALELNLNPSIYGAFAEIGAGQETANWFFRVSGAAGMVAKTISAYDMTMSDAIYGKCDRYVSRQRLLAMMEHEYGLLIERLASQRGENTQFFAFSNTVRARGWNDTAECHGWLGVRFQMRPGEPPCDIVLHLRLLDPTALEQKEVLGIVGVNLLYAAFHHRNHLKRFVESLVDGISPGRVEVDLLEFHGHGYGFFDNRLCALQLVESELTDATMFLPDGSVVQPSEVLYKRPVLLLRGSFNPVTKLHLGMMEDSHREFYKKLSEQDRGREIEVCEISTRNLLRSGELDAVTFIDRADALQALGKTVLVSHCAEFHRIAAFLNRCTNRPVGIVLSIGLLNELFKAKWSQNLAGGLLESFGRLFKNNIALYVFPWRNRKKQELVTASSFEAPENSKHLYSHFIENDRIIDVPCHDESLLRYTSRDIQTMIANDDDTWREFVPEAVHPMVMRG